MLFKFNSRISFLHVTLQLHAHATKDIFLKG